MHRWGRNAREHRNAALGAVSAIPWRISLRPGLCGALALLLAVAGTPLGAPVTRAASQDLAANCGVTLRMLPSTSSTAVTIVPVGSVITWTSIASGAPWSATCGSLVAGSTWYGISAVNGQDVASLYGVPLVYAASGLFRPLDAPAFIEGVDVSRWQGAIDFFSLQRAGKRFVIAKATEGIGFLDPMYLSNRVGASGAGMAITAYHFARPDLNPTNPQGEADWFVDNLGLVPGMLAPALDLEVPGSLDTAGLQAWVKVWLDRVYERTGIRPMIYVSPSFWKKYLADTTMFADQGYAILWVAHWFVAGPTVPANNWSNRGWTFWQYSNCGSVPGIIGCVDLDRYNGTDLTPVTYGADFAVSASPLTATVPSGSSITYDLSLVRTFFTTPIDLGVTGLPAGATATWSVSRATESSATLTVSTSLTGAPTPGGTYPLTITAIGGGLTRTATTTLTVTDDLPPVVTAPVYRLVHPSKLTASIPVQAVWSAADTSGISGHGVQRQVGGGPWEELTLPSASSTSVIESFSFGSVYSYAARATDGFGNASDWVPGTSAAVVLAEQTSSSIAYSGAWKSGANVYASGSSLKYATRSNASATYSFTGAGVAWVAYRGPNRGSARVYVDGVYKKTVSLYASTYAAKQIVFAFNWGSSGAHKIKVVAVGTRGHPRIDVDAFIRLSLP